MKPPHHTVMGIKGGAKHHFVIRDDAEHDAARVDDGWDAIGHVAAVCGLQSSGGLAIVDWLDDHGNVVGSRTENRYVSGRYGLKSLINLRAKIDLVCESSSGNEKHRVVVQNQTTGEIVGKYEVEGGRYEFNWVEHDIGQKLRYRFQGRMVYNELTVVELKDMLRGRGLPVSGRKSELVARLDDDTKWTNKSPFQKIPRLMKSKHQLLEFIRMHAIGATVPISRGVARLMSQYWEDGESGILQRHEKSTLQALKHEHCFDFIESYLRGNWTNVLEDGEGGDNKLLVIRKMFSQGKLDMLGLLPPLRIILVWRDPRDQYADRVRKKYGMAEGDVEGFVEWYWKVMNRLATSLKACSETHRANIIHIPFGRFVLDQHFRDSLAGRIGADSSTYNPENFISSESSVNVGFWKDWSEEEIGFLEERLSPVIDFCTDLKPFNLNMIQKPGALNPDDDDSTLLISCSIDH